MDTLARRQIGWLYRALVAVLIGFPAAAVAAPAGEETPVQVFSTVDRQTVARGVAFVLEVAAYATPGSPEAGAQVEEAFRAAAFTPAPASLEFVRADPVEQSRLTGDDGRAVLVLEQRFLFRSLETGEVAVPSWQMHLGARRYTASGHRVHVYEIGDGIYRSAAGVLPVVAQTSTPDQTQVFSRTGSAFLVAPNALVTALHVVLDADDVRVTLPNGRRLRLQHAWTLDPGRDVAVLYVDPVEVERAGLRPLRMAPLDGAAEPRSMRARREEVVFTEGWPGGTQRATAGVYYRDLTFQPGEVLWVSSNPVRPGDSGGPLLDAQGNVLGVVSTGAHVGVERDMPAEEMCVATDPRPALWQKLIASRPRSLRRAQRDPAFATDPHVQALRLASLMTLRRRRAPDLRQMRQMLQALDQSVVTRTPPDAGLYFVRAALHHALRTPVNPVAAYRAATDASGRQHLPAVVMLSRLLLDEGAYAEAGQLFEEVRGYPPYRHLATYGLARAHMGQLRYEEARAFLTDVLRFDPTFAAGLYYLGACHLALGDEPRARQVLVRLDALDRTLAHRLRQSLAYPSLRPVALEALPRSPLRPE